MVLGIICGLLGAFFIFVNVHLSMLRKHYIDKSWKKIAEAVFFAFMSTSIVFGVVLLRSFWGYDCVPNVDAAADDENKMRFRCPEGYFNPLATLLFNTEGGTIRQLLAFPI